MLGQLNETLITMEEVQELVEIRPGKLAELDGYAEECLISGGARVTVWLVDCETYVCVSSMVLVKWVSVCVVLCKGKGD